MNYQNAWRVIFYLIAVELYTLHSFYSIFGKEEENGNLCKMFEKIRVLDGEKYNTWTVRLLLLTQIVSSLNPVKRSWQQKMIAAISGKRSGPFKEGTLKKGKSR